MSVLELQLKFLNLAHHVPDLVSTECTKIHRSILGLGGAYTDRMEAVVLLTLVKHLQQLFVGRIA